MILSNVDIQRAIDEKRLVIDPEPSPRQPTGVAGEDCPHQTSSVDLRLGDQFSYFKEGLPLDINLSPGGFARLFGPMSESQTISGGQPFVLRPNRLVLGRTFEMVTLPVVAVGQSLAARVEGTSSYARCGLLIHFTGPTIHAGFSGTITLELINLGPCNISLYPGTPLCQLILETVSRSRSATTANSRTNPDRVATSSLSRRLGPLSPLLSAFPTSFAQLPRLRRVPWRNQRGDSGGVPSQSPLLHVTRCTGHDRPLALSARQRGPSFQGVRP